MVTAYSAPNGFEGAVRLANEKDDVQPYIGVLQVYTQDDWNLVCYHVEGKVVMNNAAAATACKQMGFLTVADDGGLQSTE